MYKTGKQVQEFGIVGGKGWWKSMIASAVAPDDVEEENILIIYSKKKTITSSLVVRTDPWNRINKLNFNKENENNILLNNVDVRKCDRIDFTFG